MKRLLTVAFTMLIGASLMFAQDTGDKTGKPKDSTKEPTKVATKAHKGGKKGHKGGKTVTDPDHVGKKKPPTETGGQTPKGQTQK